MLEIYVSSIPQEQREGLKARVVGQVPQLISPELSGAFEKDLTAIAQSGGGQFQNKNRYFSALWMRMDLQ